MSRHRNIKKLNIAEEREEYGDDYGHSVEEESCLSPGTEAQFMFRRGVNDHSLHDFIEERPDEEFEDEMLEIDADDDFNRQCDRNLTFHLDPHCHDDDESKFVKSSSEHEQKNESLATKNTLNFDSSEDIQGKLQNGIASGSRIAQLKVDDQIMSEFSKIGLRSESPVNIKPVRSGACSPYRQKSPAPIYRNMSQPELPKGKDLLNLVVIGHVDAGKSTLMGHLLYLLGYVNQKQMHKFKQDSQKVGKGSFAYAWVLDETSEERERGVTMDVAQRRFETVTKQVVLLDAPGHKDFIPNMITGAARADCALLVVNSTRGEFETGFDLGGQTREHTLLLRSFGVTQLAVAVNKLDTVDWSERRFNEIKDKMRLFLKQTGFSGDCPFVPCCGLNGDNLIERPDASHPLCQWYSGVTLLQAIDGFLSRERCISSPLRFCINDACGRLQQGGSGITVAGKLESGFVRSGDKVVILPNMDAATIKSIHFDNEDISSGNVAEKPEFAFAGDTCLVVLSGLDVTAQPQPGDVICHPDSALKPSMHFQARIVVFNVRIPITAGFPVVMHFQSASEPAVINRVLSQLNKNTGEVIKKNPRCLTRNSSALIELTTETPVCLEVDVCRELGRLTLRSCGQTIAAGLITKVL